LRHILNRASLFSTVTRDHFPCVAMFVYPSGDVGVRFNYPYNCACVDVSKNQWSRVTGIMITRDGWKCWHMITRDHCSPVLEKKTSGELYNRNGGGVINSTTSVKILNFLHEECWRILCQLRNNYPQVKKIVWKLIFFEFSTEAHEVKFNRIGITNNCWMRAVVASRLNLLCEPLQRHLD